MPLKRANGRVFHVQELGAGPPVAMVHGLVLGTLASWYFTIAHRLAHHRRVVLYDQRGHGLSEPAAHGFDLPTLAADLAAVLDEAAGIAGPVDLVGHSYGGAVLLQFALDYPDRVRRLVLVEAPLPPFSAAEVQDLLSTDPEAVLAALPEKVAPDFMGGPKRWTRRLEVAVRFRDETSLPADLAAEPGFTDEELARVVQPLLCVDGATSELPSAGKRLASRVPSARRVLLAGGHMLHIEARDELARTIEEFLDG